MHDYTLPIFIIIYIIVPLYRRKFCDGHIILVTNEYEIYNHKPKYTKNIFQNAVLVKISLTVVSFLFFFFLSSGNTETAECFPSKESFDDNFVPSHDRKCLDKANQCPKCASIAVALKQCLEHGCDTIEGKGMSFVHFS